MLKTSFDNKRILLECEQIIDVTSNKFDDFLVELCCQNYDWQ